MTNRYVYTLENRSPKEVAQLSFTKALNIAQEGGVTKIVIVAPTIKDFSHSHLGELIDNLGHANLTTSRLKRHEVIKIENISFELVSSQDIKKKIRNADILLAYCSTEKDLENIDSLYGIKNIVFSPWIAEEEEFWVSKWDPEIL